MFGGDMIATVVLIVYLGGAVVDEAEIRGPGSWNICQSIKKKINDSKTGFIAYCNSG